MLHFYSVPRWVLTPERNSPTPGPEDRLDPVVPQDTPEGVEKALARAEFAGDFALERIEELLRTQKGPVVLAQPPNDLPALLRTADQLDLLSRQDVGEKARVWRCECGTHYAVPVQLIRPVAIRCERCGRMVDFEIGNSVGEQSLLDVGQNQVNAYRKGLSEFFREAMARGWPVLVSSE